MSDTGNLENERKQEDDRPDTVTASAASGSAETADNAKVDAASDATAVAEDAGNEADGSGAINLDKEPVEPKPQGVESAPGAQGAGESEVAEKPCLCGKIFNSFASAGPLLLLLVLAALVWGGFWRSGQGVYCPPESTFVTALLHCMSENFWLAPAGLDGNAWTVAQWPVFYWIAWLLTRVPDLVSSGLLLPAMSAIAAVCILLGVWGLAIGAGFGRRCALAAGIVIICAPFFVPVAHFVGPMPMAAALMLLALAFFAKGWLKRRAWICLPLAFIFTGLAGLCGGVIYFAVPLLASIFFLIWQARFRRAHAWDAVFGFALMLVLVGGWMSWVTLAGPDNAYLSKLFSSHMLLAWPPVSLWWGALLIGFAGILPWSLIILTVSWHRVFIKSPAYIAASRKENASALVWLALVFTCLFSPFMQLPPDAGLPLIFLNAVLLGRAFINLTPLGNRAFFLLASLFVCIVGLIVLTASLPSTRLYLFALLPFQLPQFIQQALDAIGNLYMLGILLLVVGLAGLFFAKSYRQAGGLLYGVLAAIAITQFAVFMIAPDLAKNFHNGPLLNLQEIRDKVEAAQNKPGLVAPELQKPAASEQKAPETVASPEAAPAPEAGNEAAPAPDAVPAVGTPVPVERPEDQKTAPAVESESAEQPEEATTPGGAPAAPQDIPGDEGSRMPETPKPLPAE